MFNEGYLEKIYYRFFKEENAVASVFAIHGLGGHCLWFDNAGKLFSEKKINFFSFDLPGFGQSKYELGSISSYKDWLDASCKVFNQFLNLFHIKSPVFIIGHSMGALIAAIISKQINASGWILSVPGFEGNKNVFPLSFTFKVLFRSLFKPDENIMLPFGPEQLTRNRETQIRLKKDPHRVINLKPKMLFEVVLLTKCAIYFHGLNLKPVFMIQSGMDKVCSNQAMVRFFEKINSPDKEIKVYKDTYHDLFVEDNLPQIVDDISSWIINRANPEIKKV